MLKKILADKALLASLAATFGLLTIYVVGTQIPVPLIDQAALQQTMTSSSFIDVINMVSGGQLQSFSLFALGLSPYITASIVVQLLQFDVVPKLADWSKQGEQGRDKLNYLTRVLGIVFAFFQAIAITLYINMSGGLSSPIIDFFQYGWMNYLYIACMLTTGMVFLVWIADQITKRGLGNGVSLIIATGIVVKMPSMVQSVTSGGLSSAEVIALITFLVGIIILTIVCSEATRKIPIHYSNKKIYSSKVDNYLPLKLNSAGVIPVIFALTILAIPSTIASLISASGAPLPDWGTQMVTWITTNLTMGETWYNVLYFILIIAFSYFYVIVQINPERVAENLSKSGAFIPDVRPGKDTQEFVRSTLMKLTFFGSLFLALVAMLPIIVSTIFNLSSSISIGGTSLLIVVGVALDVYRRIRTQVDNKNYNAFLE